MNPEAATAFDPLNEDELNAASTASNRPSRDRCIMPVPTDAPPPPEYQKLGPSHSRWAYQDAQGRLLFYVYRWDTPTPEDPGAKEIRCLTFWQGKGWDWKHPPEPKPLYRLDRLAQRPTDPVLICEGEKAADAAVTIFPDHVVIAWPGGAKAIGKVDWQPLVGRRVIIWPDNDVAGRTCAGALGTLLQEVGAENVAVVTVPESWPPNWDVADSLPEGVTLDDLLTLLHRAVPAKAQKDWRKATATKNDGRCIAADEPPLPLRRSLPEPEPFPIAALSHLRPAAEAIHDLTQAPLAICGQSVLAVASLAVQAHADVLLPTGQHRPTSCFFLTVAASGERKTSCDNYALAPVQEYLGRLRLEHESEVAAYRDRSDIWKVARDKALKGGKDKTANEADLRALGNEPVAPPEPRILCDEPTIEGVFKLLRRGLGFAGLFSAEGGSFVGGYGMSQDQRLKTAAHLSSLWDGTPISRTRGSDDLSILYGRRFAVHLMVQPSIAMKLLGDAELLDQGLLSRILVTAPAPTAGSRRWREPSPSSAAALMNYGQQICTLLNRPRQHADGRPTELTPRILTLTADARQLWVQYHDKIEAECGPSGALAAIGGLAAKLPEHAARLAAVLAVVANPDAAEIDGERMAAGIDLAQHYQSEALRLFETGATNPDLALAERVLDFMREQGGTVGLRQLYQFGPNAVRDAETARRIMGILEHHRQVVSLRGGEVNGKRVREIWKMVGP